MGSNLESSISMIWLLTREQASTEVTKDRMFLDRMIRRRCQGALTLKNQLLIQEK
jgi:hypothetical protein